MKVWRQESVIYVMPESPIEHTAARNVADAMYLPDFKVFRHEATPGIAGRLYTAFGNGAVYDTGFRRLLKEWVAYRRGRAVPELAWPTEVRTAPWDHQLHAFRMAQDRLDHGGGFGLWLAMGTGKSMVVLATIAHRKPSRVLIVCPKSMVEVWPDVFAQHAPDLAYVVPLRGTVEQRAKLVHNTSGESGKPVVWITNYDAYWQGALGRALSQRDIPMVVLDESHKIKSPGGKASLFAQRLGAKARERIALSGTPAHHSPLDVYAQYRFLDPAVFGTSFQRFKADYAVEVNRGKYQQVVGFRNLDDLNARMYQIAYRVGTDVMSLPDIVYQEHLIDLGDETRKAYDTLAKTLVLEIDGGTVTAGNALVKLLRLQQITSGYASVNYGVDESRVMSVGEEKYEALKDIFDGLPESEPVVVFCRFTHDLERVAFAAEESKRGYRELSGRRDQHRRWQREDAGGEVLGVQVQAGSAGIDLTRAAHVVFYSTGFSLGDYDQALARVYRTGQKRTTFVHYLLCRQTVDTMIRKAIQTRADIVTYVVDELTREYQP